MKVVRLSTFLDFGGIETKMANLSLSYSKEIEWIFVAIGKGGCAETKIRNNNKQVFCLDKPHKIPSIFTIFYLYKLFKKILPDIVHCSGSEANFHGVIAARMAGIKFIVSEEIGISNKSAKAQFIFKYIYKIADCVLGESKKVVDDLNLKYTIAPDKLFVVHNFIDIDRKVEKQKIPVDSQILNIVTVSRLEPVKNILGVLDAIKNLKLNGYLVSYTVVGDGSMLSDLVNKTIELEITEEVKFVGYQTNVSVFYEKADLFILNSFSEGFSNSLLEAMLMEIPSITTNVGAAEEIIENGKNGWIIENNDKNELYNCLVNFINLSDNDKLIVGINGRKKILDNFSLPAHINVLNKIYKNGR